MQLFTGTTLLNVVNSNNRIVKMVHKYMEYFYYSIHGCNVNLQFIYFLIQLLIFLLFFALNFLFVELLDFLFFETIYVHFFLYIGNQAITNREVAPLKISKN